jgi:hypothetical protein
LVTVGACERDRVFGVVAASVTLPHSFMITRQPAIVFAFK